MKDIIARVQRIDYEALCCFKDFCDRNDIKFYMRGGSVMGAVKYRGFIPWDDDIDVAIPREDYERLIPLTQNLVLDDRFEIISYKYNMDIHCYYPRMVLRKEYCISMGLPQNTNLGLHIMDIFPLDGAPENVFKRKIYIAHVYFLRVLASLGTHYTGEWKEMHSKKQKVLIRSLRMIGLEKLFPQKIVYEKIDKLYKKHDWKVTHYRGTISASLFAKEIMPSDIWGEGTVKHIYELEVLVPEKYDEYLKKLYGNDYLTVEPSEKKSHLNEV